MLTDLKNPLNLSDHALESLEQALQEYRSLDAELPVRLLHYLVDGDDEAAIQDTVRALHHQFNQYYQTLQSQTAAGSLASLASFQTPMLLARNPLGDNLLLTWLEVNLLTDPGFYSRLSCISCGFFGSSIDAAGNVQLAPLQDRLPQFLQMIVPHHYSPETPAAQFITAEIIDAMYVEEGEPTGTLARQVYFIDPKDYRQEGFAQNAVKLTGFADYTLKHSTIAQEALQQPERERRIHTLKILSQAEVPLGDWLEAIATSAVSSAKTEREVASVLLRREPQAAIPILRNKAESGSNRDRQHAVKLLWDLAGEAIRPFLAARLEVEKTAKVRSAIEQLIAQPLEVAVEETNLSLPALLPVDFDTPLPKRALELCKQIEHEYYQSLSQGQPPSQTSANSDPTSPVLVDILQKGSLTDCYKHQYFFRKNRSNAIANSLIQKCVKDLLALADFQLIHAVRLLVLMRRYSHGDYYVDRYKYLFEDEGHELLLHYHTHHPESGLRELAKVFERLQLPKDQIQAEISQRFLTNSQDAWDQELNSLSLAPERIGLEMLYAQHMRGFWRWDSEAIWPYFAERLPLLTDSFASQVEIDWWQRYQNQTRRKNAFKVLRMFPQPPVRLVPTLWDLALEGAKDERPIAQSCLNALDSTEVRLLTTLTDTNRDLRTIAAAWLGDRGDPAAIKPLKQALKQEKSDAAKDIMLRSLEKLGASVDEFLDRDNLLQDSQTLLKKGIPAALNWFPWLALPAVHWRDSGEAVAPDILKGLLLQCFKQKNAEPGPILKRYVEMWQPDDREALGQFVLESWINQDTLPAHTPQEADQQAQTYAQQQFQQYQQYQQRYPNATGAYYHTTYEELYQSIYNNLIRTCKGSAIKEKGILAIAAACCSPRAISPINTYLKTWYGNRMAQCKALLQVLAWMDNNSATQLLLSVANRFRTKGIQKEAEKLVTELAERNGWSRDELSDRTMPTAGFDDGIEQTLDYGSRQFTLLLDTDMSLVLKNPDGKVIKSLPAPRKDDDPELAKAAKKQLSDTKKQVKQVLSLQRERLYEAMCTQRSWRFDDWDTYLNRHPIVGRYCQQLVWAIYEPGTDGETLVHTVRPLEDRTLTDAEDEEVTPNAEAIVRLAHTCTIPAAAIAAWQTHFTDYDVTPLFPQFRPHPYVLPEAQQQATEITDFEGHIIEALKLRGLLTKRGYTRGQTEDAGWFYDYRKRFSGLGIEAVMEFSGNYLPEENRPVALTKLVFYELPEEGESEYIYSHPKLALGELPPVLLSEVWSELQAIAAQGSGYDPDWEKKVEY